MNSWIIKVGFLLFLFCSKIVSGQNKENTDIKQVVSILKTELRKTGLPISDIDFNGASDKSGIHLSLLQKGDHDPYNLLSQPEDAFYVKATDKVIKILAASPNGLRNGSFWYLHFLGFRYYFPESSWHVIPRLLSIYKPVEKIEFPSYVSRRIWYAYGSGSKKADADFKLWTDANLLGGEDINAGHSYEAIVNRNKEVFLHHPEFFAQDVKTGSIPRNPKFEVGNGELVQLCINDAFYQIESYQKKTGTLPSMISMDPSDGAGFSIRETSLKIGGPSEQTFYLANKVAKAIKVKYPSVKVGLYAYNFHSAPPKLSLEPNIVVLIATAYNQSTYTIDQLIDLWQKKGVGLGIRDYFGVLAWDWDMPGQARGGKVDYVKSIRDYHSKGIRIFSAETNIGWISRGLGHYIAARLLWDVNSDIEAIKSEFFQHMFGKAATDIQKLYISWERYKQSMPLEGDLLNWFAVVERAEAAEGSLPVKERLKQIKEYLYYTYLYKKWREEGGDENLINLLNFAYRVQEKGVLSSYPLFRTLANSAVKGKPNMRFNEPNAKWKINKDPVTYDELKNMIGKAILALNPKLKTFSTNWPEEFELEPLKRNLSSNSSSPPIRLRGLHKVIFFVGNPGGSSINLATGFIKSSRLKPLNLRIYKYNQDLSTKDDRLVLQETIQSKKPLLSISLASLKPDVYLAVIDDGMEGFMVNFTGSVAYGIVADNQIKTWTLNRTNLVFEVQNGVKEFVLQTDGVLTLKSPNGRVIDLQKKGFKTIAIEVNKNEVGIWKINHQSGRFWIQGIMPIVAPEEKYILRKYIP